jgi:cell volume regulation protein A
VIYGAASAAHGVGFLAVFVAPAWRSATQTCRSGVDRALSHFARQPGGVVVFVALGLTIDVTDVLTSTRLLEGLPSPSSSRGRAPTGGRPAAAAGAHAAEGAPVRDLGRAARGCADPAHPAFALLADVEDARRVYEIVFVVVAFSVLVQGSRMPWVARRLGIPMRAAQ